MTMAEPKTELKNIWRESMTRLEAYDPMVSEKQVTQNVNIEQEVKQAKQTREQVMQEIANKQKAGKTATDLKSWWGQAVATWDPEDAKNIDTIEKKIQGPKGTKWNR